MTMLGHTVVAARSANRNVVAAIDSTRARAEGHRDWLQAKADREPPVRRRHLRGRRDHRSRRVRRELVEWAQPGRAPKVAGFAAEEGAS
jgi:hypothetical protein